MDTQDDLYRHVVLFQFKDGTPEPTLRGIERAFGEFCSGLGFVKAFEWGLNSSPEGLDRGFTHCFLVTFANAADRDRYLPHPAHRAFIAAWLDPHVAQVCVVDFEPRSFK